MGDRPSEHARLKQQAERVDAQVSMEGRLADVQNQATEAGIEVASPAARWTTGTVDEYAQAVTVAIAARVRTSLIQLGSAVAAVLDLAAFSYHRFVVVPEQERLAREHARGRRRWRGERRTWRVVRQDLA